MSYQVSLFSFSQHSLDHQNSSLLLSFFISKLLLPNKQNLSGKQQKALIFHVSVAWMDSSALHCRFDWTCLLNEGQPQFCAICIYSGAQTERGAATQGNSWFASNREVSIEICSMSEDLSVELKRSHFYTGYIVQSNHMGKPSISEMKEINVTHSSEFYHTVRWQRWWKYKSNSEKRRRILSDD